MALVKCEDCGHEVSTQAAACPNCGRPMSATSAQTPAAEPAPAPDPTAAQSPPPFWPPPQGSASASPGPEPTTAQSPPPIWPPPQGSAGVQPPTPKKQNWFQRHKVVTAILAVIVLIVIIAAAAGGSTKKNAADTNNTLALGNPTTDASPPTTTAPPPKPVKPKPSLTGPQQQAIESAQGYLSEDNGFSRAGLIHQLSSAYGEGFPKAVAVFAVDHLNVDWNQQAVYSARGYKSTGGGFSCSGMIHQLSSAYGERFTHAQAVYGAKRAGVC